MPRHSSVEVDDQSIRSRSLSAEDVAAAAEFDPLPDAAEDPTTA